MHNKFALVVAMLVLFAMPAMAAKKKAAEKPKAQAAVGNWLDLREELFACNEQGCALPVRGILIGCNQEGCRPITDILVPAGQVKRFVPQNPATAPMPEAPKK